MQITFDLNTKNHTHIATLIVEATAPPRVGEYIDTPTELQEWTQRLPLLVTDVRYQLIDGGMAATVTCIARGDDAATHRSQLLQEQGWLQASE